MQSWKQNKQGREVHTSAVSPFQQETFSQVIHGKSIHLAKLGNVFWMAWWSKACLRNTQFMGFVTGIFFTDALQHQMAWQFVKGGTQQKDNKLPLLLLQVQQRPSLLASCQALFCSTLAPSSGKLPSLHPLSIYSSLENIYLTLFNSMLQMHPWGTDMAVWSWRFHYPPGRRSVGSSFSQCWWA